MTTHLESKTYKIHVAVGSKNPCKIDSVKSAFQKVFEKHLPSFDKESDVVNNDCIDRGGVRFELVFSSHSVPSKVSDQPIGDDETLLGAKNRALGAFQSAKDEYEKRKMSAVDGSCDDDYGLPDFAVGLEGGIEIRDFHHNSSTPTTENSGNNINENNNNNNNKISNDQVWCMAWMAIVGSDSTICTLCKHESSIHSNHNTNFRTTSSATNNADSSSLKWGISKTAAFQLPQKISHLILNEKIELGHADDMVFNRVNSKQGSGTVGILTNHLITRSGYYDHALILALISFIWPEHYDNSM